MGLPSFPAEAVASISRVCQPYARIVSLVSRPGTGQSSRLRPGSELAGRVDKVDCHPTCLASHFDQHPGVTFDGFCVVNHRLGEPKIVTSLEGEHDVTACPRIGAQVE